MDRIQWNAGTAAPANPFISGFGFDVPEVAPICCNGSSEPIYVVNTP